MSPQHNSPAKTSRLPFSNVFYGWWIIWAYFLALTYSAGVFIYGLPAIVNPVREDLGWTVGAISLAFSLQRLENGLLAPVVGQLIDRFGPRKLVFFGATTMCLGFVVLSFTHSFAVFYLGVFLTAIGNTFQSSSVGLATVANWFKRRRALAMSVIIAGGGFAGVFVPLVSFMVDTLGWRHALQVMSAGFWIFSLPIILIIKHHPEPHGYQVDGGPEPAKPAEGNPVPPVRAVNDQPEFTLKEALHSRHFWLLAVGIACVQFTLSPLLAFSFPALEDKGVSRSAAGWVITAYTLTSVLARFVIGYLADKVDKQRLYVVTILLQIGGILLFVVADSWWMLVPFIVVYGFGYGGGLPLRPAIQADYFGRKAFGAINGMLVFVLMFTAVSSPYIAGTLHDVTGEYTLGFLILAGMTSFSIPLILLSRPKRKNHAAPAPAARS